MATESKIFAAQTKVVGDGDSYQYESLVSVFGNRDHAGDVVQPGAFQKSLDSWAASGAPIPVYYAHRMDDPDMCIGTVMDAAEVLPGDPRLAGAKGVAATNGGLWTRIQLDRGHPKADRVWQLIKDGRLNQASFTYEVKDGAMVWPMANEGEKEMPPYYELNELDLFEVGPCPLGCNDATQVLATKSRQQEMARAAGHERKDLAGPSSGEDTDEDPKDLVAALDATLDEAAAYIGGMDVTTLPDDVQQCLALVVAAEAQADALMELLGIPDPDDSGDGDEAKAWQARAKAQVEAGLAYIRRRYGGKVGRALSAAREKDLRDAHALIAGVLSSVSNGSTEQDDTGKARLLDLKLRQAAAELDFDPYEEGN